jgi:hypothetical protein
MVINPFLQQRLLNQSNNSSKGSGAIPVKVKLTEILQIVWLMPKENAIKLFQNQRMRVHWSAENEKWYFSIIDAISLLTNSINPQAYWRKPKERLKKEGNETVTNCCSLKIVAADRKCL